MTYDTIISALGNDGVRTITLNRPQALNAMNAKLVEEVTLAFDHANADAETQVIIFTGAGRAFCSGDDLVEHTHPETQDAARAAIDAIQQATNAIALGDKVVVGAINGWAVGGGFEWAINCDFPIWAESAKGFFPELHWGMFVTGGVTALLPALVGLNKARELLFLGERHGAKALHDMGLAWRVVPDDALLSEADKVAARLAALPQGAVRDMKRTLARTACTDIQAAIALETEATLRGFMDPKTIERIRQFGS